MKYAKLFKGKKTHIMAIVGALLVFARLANFITDEQFQLMAALAGFSGMSALRLGMKK